MFRNSEARENSFQSGKAIFGILLILILVTPFITNYTYFQIKKYQVKKEVKRKIMRTIDRNELVTLAFTKSEIETELRWEHSKEFEYRGEMYDIVETHTIGDSIFYICWWDHEETILNQKLKTYIADFLANDKESNEINFTYNHHTKTLFFVHAITFNPIINSNTIKYYDKFRDFTNYYIEPSSPPPKNS